MRQSKKGEISWVELVNAPWIQIILVILFALIPMLTMIGELMDRDVYLRTFIARDISIMRDALATKQPNSDGEAVFSFPSQYRYFSYEFYQSHIEVFDARKVKVVPKSQRAFFYFIPDKALTLRHSLLTPSVVWDPSKSDVYNKKHYSVIPKFCIGKKEMFVVDKNTLCGDITQLGISVTALHFRGQQPLLALLKTVSKTLAIKPIALSKSQTVFNLVIEPSKKTIVELEVPTQSKESLGLANLLKKKIEQLPKPPRVVISPQNKHDQYKLYLGIKAKEIAPLMPVLTTTLKDVLKPKGP